MERTGNVRINRATCATCQGQLKTMAGSELELEAIKGQVEDETQGELCREQDVTVDAETVETDVGAVEEIDHAEDSIGDNEGNLRQYQAIVEQLNRGWHYV